MRATLLYKLGYCLQNQQVPLYEASVACYREALWLLEPAGQKERRAGR